MRIIYTKHALIRMVERSITELMVQEALKNPDQVILSFSDTKRYLRNKNDRTLEIICTWEYDRVIIITLYTY